MIPGRRFLQVLTGAMAIAILPGLADEVAPGQDAVSLRADIARLERQNASLRAAYAQAKADAAGARDQLTEIKRTLEALGPAALAPGDQRLVKAVADIEVLTKRQRELEDASASLSAAVMAYLKTSVTDNAQSRAAIEVSLRELDKTLGMRQQPHPEKAGSLLDAKVVSIDSDSGLIVLNVGSLAGLRTGMPLQVMRGDQSVGEALVTDVRQSLAGAFVQKLEHPGVPVRTGDTVSVKTLDQ